MFPDLSRDDVFRIETQRLWLRWPRVADATAFARLAGEKSVAGMTARIPHPLSLHQAEQIILRQRMANTSGDGLFLAITTKHDPDTMLGLVQAFWPSGGEPNIGYLLGTPSWGKGLATEATQAMIDIVFTLTSASHLDASVVPINTASHRVLKKCGFAQCGSGLNEAPARGGAQAVDFYQLDRSIWKCLKNWRNPGMVREGHMPALPEAEMVCQVA